MLSRMFLLVALPACILCSGLSAGSRPKQEFTSLGGDSVKGELVGAYDGIVYIEVGRGRISLVGYRDLDDLSREPVNQWFEGFAQRLRDGPGLVAKSDSKLAAFLASNLQLRQDGRLVNYEFSSKPEPDFYGFYFSAHWCGPCRRFTPKLREFYNGMKAAGHENFEIVFVSSDTSAKMMETYMEEDQMPWPALKYSRRSSGVVSKYKGDGIPCLVITDRYGNLLAHSYSGDEYVGPDVPMDRLASLLSYTAAIKAKLAEKPTQ